MIVCWVKSKIIKLTSPNNSLHLYIYNLDYIHPSTRLVLVVFTDASLNIQESMVNFCISINEGMWSVVLVPHVVMMILQQHLEEPHKLEWLWLDPSLLLWRGRLPSYWSMLPWARADKGCIFLLLWSQTGSGRSLMLDICLGDLLM